MPLYNVSDFSASGNAAAGKSPSFRAKLSSNPEGPNYQLKSSNSTRATRKIIGYDPDSSDMIGEFIASVMMRADYEQLGNTTKAELSPEVSLVLDQEANRVMLASKYLNDKTGVEAAGMTIDELWHKKLEFEGKKKPDKGHVRLVMPGKGTGRDDEIEMDKEFTIKVKDQEFTLKIDSKEVAQAIVKSAKYGDHDVNPGNMFYVVDIEQKKGFVGRIDYGHAFNDLIKNFKLIGSGKNLPVVENGRGLVLDYFNRDSVNMDKTTKFMRDYGGMTPSEEMIGALREEATRDMKPMYEALAKGMKDFSEGLENSSPELQKELRSSLMTLSKRIGSSLKKIEFKNNDDMCAVFATKIVNSIENNRTEMESVANVMEVQKLVKDFAAGKSDIKDPLELNKKIIEIYQKDQKYLNGNISNNVEWIRETADKKPFKGKLSDLVLEESKKITSPELEDNISRLHSYIVSAEKGKPVQGSFTARFSSASSQQQDLVR